MVICICATIPKHLKGRGPWVWPRELCPTPQPRFNQHVIATIHAKDQECFFKYWSEGWGSKTSAWPISHNHKKITLKLYKNNDFHQRVQSLGVGSIEQRDFAQRPRHGISIDLDVKRPLMGQIMRKNSFNLYYLSYFYVDCLILHARGGSTHIQSTLCSFL